MVQIGVAAVIIAIQHKTNMKVSELIQVVKDCRNELVKAKAEIIAKIARLENADGDLTPEQQAAVEDLKATVQGIDDIVPDDPTAPGAPTVVDDTTKSEPVDPNASQVDPNAPPPQS